MDPRTKRTATPRISVLARVQVPYRAVPYRTSTFGAPRLLPSPDVVVIGRGRGVSSLAATGTLTLTYKSLLPLLLLLLPPPAGGAVSQAPSIAPSNEPKDNPEGEAEERHEGDDGADDL